MSYTNETASELCAFIKQTPEGNLRKMLVDSQLTDAHFRILMKLAKGGPEAEFVDAFVNDNMGKLRLSPKEAPLRDNFWSVCKKKMVSLGLLPAASSTSTSAEKKAA